MGGECAVEWENVEELSAAVSDERKPAQAQVKVSKEDMAVIKSAKEALASASVAKEFDPSVVKGIESAVAGMKEVAKKVSSEKVTQLEKELQAALEAAKACTDDCAVAWEAVEEISSAMSHEKGK